MSCNNVPSHTVSICDRIQSPIGNGTGLIGEAGRKPVGENAFDDLLGGFAKKDTGPRTMAEMKRVEMAKEMDPVRLVVSSRTLRTMSMKRPSNVELGFDLREANNRNMFN